MKELDLGTCNMIIRPTQIQDIAELQNVLDDTGLFPREMLPDMIRAFFSEREINEIWLTCDDNGLPVGFCYAAPEKLAEGTYNMLAIAVLSSFQHKGYGGAIISKLEDMLREQGHRIIIADTSGSDEFAKTREFYKKNGYTKEAVIRDFWSEGNDKIVYWKSLRSE
jgi:ribosomal protein S18 acetylase RimI-like enzyme